MIGKTNSIEAILNFSIDNNTVFLLTDSLEDKSANHYTVQNFGVTISDTMTRDDRNSLYFNSTNKTYLKIYDVFQYLSGTSDWTVEYWIYPISNSGYVYHHQRQPGTAYGILIGGQDTATNRALYLTNAANSGWTISNKAMASSSLVSQWIHYAVVRYNNQILNFCNGALINTTAYTINIPVPETYPIIGAYWYTNNSNTAAPNSCLNSYLQDFRISNIARYTAAFTPPTRFI